MPKLVYFSSASGNTHRFVTRLGLEAHRIPIDATAELPSPQQDYVLICPTFADGKGNGAVPKQVIRFLNNPANREKLKGVIAGGNRNFGETYALAGKVIATKCNVPVLYSFELAGTEKDIARVRHGLELFWGN